ncbi:MAG: type II toxin-antitoxin system VapC family toxin, partial [Chloroflexi bacterium]|nr:type II toxin-antitoxin system VapC family toxin [Chloroflexota bacterium]
MTLPRAGGYVLDASVVAKWFTRHEEIEREAALGLRRRYLAGEIRLLVPDLCLIEVANAIRFSSRAKEELVSEALEAMRGLSLEVTPTGWNLLLRANAISWKSQTTLYDAVYVALAEQAGEVVVERAAHGT